MNEFMGKKILIVGGTGQIGSFLAEELIDKGADVYILGRNIKKEYFEGTKIYEFGNFIKFDLINDHFEDIKNKIKNIDYLVHAFSDISHESNNVFHDAHNSINVNLKILPSLLMGLKSIKGVCFLSSIAVYGKTPSIPIDENYLPNPTTFYGCGKLGAEKFLQNYCNYMQIPLTILRISQVFGPRNLSNQVIPTFIKKSLKNEPINVIENICKDFIYVTDVVDAIIASILKNKNEVFNIATGNKISINEIADIILKLTRSKKEIYLNKKEKEFDSIIKINKAQSELNFSPKISIDEGLNEEIKWHIKYNNNGNFKKFGE